MLYTGKGDKGDTTHPAVGKRVSKTDPVIEALGAVDELNTWIGLCRVKAGQTPSLVIASPLTAVGGRGNLSLTNIFNTIQHDLFIIQAELVGMKKLDAEKIKQLEQWIVAIEAELPPIKTFFLPGGTELSALLDIARTVCRRAERRVVALSERNPLNPNLLAYLNRLSSLLYALVRLVNHHAGVAEERPKYE